MAIRWIQLFRKLPLLFKTRSSLVFHAARCEKRKKTFYLVWIFLQKFKKVLQADQKSMHEAFINFFDLLDWNIKFTFFASNNLFIVFIKKFQRRFFQQLSSNVFQWVNVGIKNVESFWVFQKIITLNIAFGEGKLS